MPSDTTAGNEAWQPFRAIFLQITSPRGLKHPAFRSDTKPAVFRNDYLQREELRQNLLIVRDRCAG